MIVRWSVILAACLLVVVNAAPSGDVTTPQDVTPTPTPKPQVNVTKDDEEVANVEQVPPPAPLITESAQQGYRMPGLYALGSQPFYLERDPVTGAVDFSHPNQGDETHRFSSKVSQQSGAHDDDYDETAVADDFEGDPIDRKDTFVSGSDRPNDIKPYKPDFTPYYQSNNFRDKNKQDKFPLISNSYANTKVQGMGLTKPEPTKSTPSNPPPSYYSPNPKTTTESILDFWPQKGSVSTTNSPPPSPPPDMYEYYEGEEPTEELEQEEYQTPSTIKVPSSTSPSVVNSKPYSSTPVVSEEPSTVSPDQPSQKPVATAQPSQKPVTFSRPYGYEEPFRPIYGPGEGEEQPSVKWPEDYKPVERPLPPSIYNLPPRFDTPPPPKQQQQPPHRPAEVAENRPVDDYEPSIFSPPPVPIYNQQPGQRRPPPSIVPLPPVYEPSRYRPEEGEEEGGDDGGYTLKPVQIDSQGWKQATYTQTSPQPTPTTRGPFSEGPEDTFTTLPYPSSPNSFRQPLPQGYEPKRPYPPQFRPQQRPRPGDVRRPLPDDVIRPNFEHQRPNFDHQRPNFERPNRLPVDGRPPFEGNIRSALPGGPPSGQNRRHNQPPRRWDNRPQGPQFNGPPPQQGPHGMFKNNQGPPPEAGLPNILPQFRPNANVAGDSPNFRPPPPPNRRQSSAAPGYIMYPPSMPSPPPSPPVGRRVGSQVSTLQMMQHGSLPRLSARDDAPHPNPRPPPQKSQIPYEVRPSKYGPNPQSTEERPVFVVYANAGDNQEAASDVLVGTHGLHKPLPPSHLSEQEEPVLSTKPRQPPVRTHFPYALEKPAQDKLFNNNNNNKDSDRDEEINIIPNLQDYMPFAIKSTTKTQTTYAPSTTPLVVSETNNPVRSTVSIIRPQTDNNEFTVSAVMHTGHPAVPGTGSVMVVAPQHRNPVQTEAGSVMVVAPQHRNPVVPTEAGSVMVVAPQHRNPGQTSAAPAAMSHESFNFQAPFHPSANVAPSPGNGWSAVKGSQQSNNNNNEALLRPGTVDRADVQQEIIHSAPSTITNNKFDIENFKPDLQGGFKPIYSLPEESTEKKPSTEREEKNF